MVYSDGEGFTWDFFCEQTSKQMVPSRRPLCIIWLLPILYREMGRGLFEVYQKSHHITHYLKAHGRTGTIHDLPPPDLIEQAVWIV
jgi:hypothetical protein